MADQRWRWRSGAGPPPAAAVQALNAAIAAGSSDRAQALQHAVELTAGCEQRGSNAEAVAVALCEGGILGAAAEALGPSTHPLDHSELDVSSLAGAAA